MAISYFISSIYLSIWLSLNLEGSQTDFQATNDFGSWSILTWVMASVVSELSWLIFTTILNSEGSGSSETAYLLMLQPTFSLSLALVHY